MQRQRGAGTVVPFVDVPNLDACISIYCDSAALSPSLSVWRDHLEADPRIYAAFGCHPHNSKYFNKQFEASVREALLHPRAVAVGECGLDNSKRCPSPQDTQLSVFAAHCKMAVELNKPLVVHSRGDEALTLRVLRENLPASHRGVHIHCFSGSFLFRC